jgi:hypothetical protein
MTTFKRIALCAILGVFALIPAFAQTFTLTQTTLSAAIGAADTVIYVASATNINAPNIRTTTFGSQLFVQSPGSKGEVMTVQMVSGTTITVRRGQKGTSAAAQVSGAMVLVGQPSWFFEYDPIGACTASTVYVSPWINTNTSNQWLCSSVTGSWVPGFNNDLLPTVPTVAVASAAGLITPSGPLFHITGTAAITGFNIPVGFAFGGICAIPDGAFTTTNANNIAIASTGVVSKPLCWTYDPGTAKFYPAY